MKIAVWYNLKSGGAKRALYYQVKGLIERGHTVEAWCPSTADRSFMPIDELAKETVLPLPWKEYCPANLWTKALKYRNISDKIRLMEKHSAECAEQIDAGTYDVLFVSPDYYLSVPMIGRYVNCPKLLYLQEPIRELYEFDLNHPYIGGNSQGPLEVLEREIILSGFRKKARVEQQNARAYDRILVNSHFSLENVAKCYGLDSSVCYLGIDTGLFKPGHGGKENQLVAVGSISKNKRPDLIIKAMGHLKDLGIRLVWVGNFADELFFKQMKDLAQKVGAEVEFCLSVSDQVLLGHLQRSRLMIYASRLEPFGFAPLEANACGLPVVAVAEGGVRETVVNGVNGLLVGQSEIELANAARKLLMDSEMLDRMSQAAVKHVVDNWRWDKSIDCLERHLREISVNNHVSK